jgi:hypothetical protein
MYAYAQNNPLAFVDPDGRNPLLARAAVWLSSTPLGKAISNFSTVQSISRGLDAHMARTISFWSNIGSTAYIRATQFLNSPVGQEFVEATAQAATGVDAPTTPTAVLASNVEKQSIRVIGHFPEYVETAEKLGVRFFSIPEKIWSAMTPTHQWAANQKFLDRAIARGAYFVLATSRDKIRRGSYLEREVSYLLSQGYEWAEDGTTLVRRH